jgi:hypothetical protein
MAKRCKKSGMREMTDPSFVAKLPTPVQPGSGSKGLSQPARRHPRLQTRIQACSGGAGQQWANPRPQSVDALRLSTLRKPNPPMFGGCAALIHSTKAKSADVRWMRCAYPPYESQTRRCSVDALRLSTPRKPSPPMFGGCAALIHPTKAKSAVVRWMRCAYPPYESQVRRCSVDALRLSTLRSPIRCCRVDKPAGRIHHGTPRDRRGWVRRRNRANGTPRHRD